MSRSRRVLAFFGFRQGFIVGALSFGGFAIGAFLGTRLGPLLLPQGSSSPYAPAFGLLGALLGGAILASGLEGLGFRLRRTLIIPGMGLLDGAARRARSARRSGWAIVWIARRRRGPDARPERSCAPTSSARRSCASSTRCCPRRGRS